MNSTPSPRPLPEPRDVHLSLPGAELEGSLTIPEEARGLVLFAHGSGSSRHSPRNRYVAEILQTAGLGTLLMDLLTREEDEVDRFTRQFRFDIGLLADRLTGAIDWLERQPETRELSNRTVRRQHRRRGRLARRRRSPRPRPHCRQPRRAPRPGWRGARTCTGSDAVDRRSQRYSGHSTQRRGAAADEVSRGDATRAGGEPPL